MLQSASIAMPTASTSPAPTTPRMPRQQPKKSGIAVALQNQNNNMNTNGARQHRNPAQTHARHQSMPSQPRPTPGSPSLTGNAVKGSSNATLSKRVSVSVVAVAPASSSTVSAIQILKNQNQQSNTNSNERHMKPKPNAAKNLQAQGQQQQNGHGNNSRSKRNQQRRKDKDTAVPAAEATKMDSDASSSSSGTNLSLEQSPPLNPSSPPSSSTDSDDSESFAILQSSPSSSPSPRPRPIKGANKVGNGRQNGRAGGKVHGLLSASPPQRPSSAPALPQQRKGAPMPQRQQNHHQLQNTQPQGEMTADSQFRPNVSKAVSADKIMLADRVMTEKKIANSISPASASAAAAAAAALYAGPTFHNSPAPTSLPIPAFVRPSAPAPVPVPVEEKSMAVQTMPTMPAAPFFGEGASPQLNNSRNLPFRPQRTQSETTGWMTHAHAHHSMPGWTTSSLYPSVGMNHRVPERMVTSSFTMDTPMTMPISMSMYGAPVADPQLLEISQNLRNLLKIQSQ